MLENFINHLRFRLRDWVSALACQVAFQPPTPTLPKKP